MKGKDIHERHPHYKVNYHKIRNYLWPNEATQFPGKKTYGKRISNEGGNPTVFKTINEFSDEIYKTIESGYRVSTSH